MSFTYSGTSVRRPPSGPRQSGLLSGVVLLARFISIQLTVTGTEGSGLVSEVGLVTEVVFNRGSTVI